MSSDTQVQHTEAMEKRSSSTSGSSSSNTTCGNSSNTASTHLHSQQQIQQIETQSASVAGSTSPISAASIAASVTIFSLRTIERQLVMSYLDRSSSLRFARTCQHIYADALHSFPHHYQPHLSIKCSDAEIVEGFVRSPLLRHFPAIDGIVDYKTAHASFERLLSTGTVQAVSAYTQHFAVPSVLESFVSVLQHHVDSAHNTRSLSLVTLDKMYYTRESDSHSIDAIVSALLPLLHRLRSVRVETTADVAMRGGSAAVATTIAQWAPQLRHVRVDSACSNEDDDDDSILTQTESQCVEALAASLVDRLRLQRVRPRYSQRLRNRQRSLHVCIGSTSHC